MPVIKCCYCNKNVVKGMCRYNEAKKFGWKQFCSVKCLGLFKQTRVKLTCSRDGCNNKFTRVLNQFKRMNNHYCSHRCLALAVNSKRILKPKKKCQICNKEVLYGKLYCSPKCQYTSQETPISEMVTWAKDFFRLNLRIPLKAECAYYSSIRRKYGTWNNFISEIGFTPNPVMFAKKYIAQDGHKCDSMAERIIDDWLYRRKIIHKRSVPYPNNEKFTADFVIGNKWVEYFGLSGNLKRYDYLKNRKIRIARKLGLDLVKLYPKDLFPKGKLKEKLKVLF